MKRTASLRIVRAFAVTIVWLTLSGPAWSASPQVDDSRLLLPHNWVRGYFDFELAPPHHEIDLGVCVVPGSECSGFARYSWSAYVEAQPFGKGILRHAFLFIEPTFYGGDNRPQLQYTGSADLILWERSTGLGWDLPRGFQLRLTQHQGFMLGRFTLPGTIGLRPDGPYGLNTRIGLRWNFGGWENSSGRTR